MSKQSCDYMLEKKTWEEFRNTGLLFFVNSFLHIFGWAICLDFEDDKLIGVYPSRCKYRGFDNEIVSSSYIKLSEWMKDNADVLYRESLD